MNVQKEEQDVAVTCRNGMGADIGVERQEEEQLVSWFIGILSRVNHKGLHQG